MLSQLCVHQPIAARRYLRSILVSRHQLLLIVPRELDLHYPMVLLKTREQT